MHKEFIFINFPSDVLKIKTIDNFNIRPAYKSTFICVFVLICINFKKNYSNISLALLLASSNIFIIIAIDNYNFHNYSLSFIRIHIYL